MNRGTRMRTPERRIGASLLLAILVALLGSSVLAQEQDQQQDAQGEVVEIEMVTEGGEYYFDPAGVQVEPGTTIRFVNVSGSHNTVSYSEDNDKPQRIPEDAEGWASQIFSEEGATFEVTLDAEGVYDYFCQPHEALGMVGRIIVGSAEASPAAEPGELEFDAAAQRLPEVSAIQDDDDGRVTFEEFQGQGN